MEADVRLRSERPVPSPQFLPRALLVGQRHRWAAGENFTLADCAAAPALFYADWARPILTDTKRGFALLRGVRSGFPHQR